MSRKQQRRQRHRVEREVEEAWQALEDGERALAVRLARRARESGAMNARVLLDCGRILLACGEREDAEAALRAAIGVAPNYADAFAALAELQAEMHKTTAAVRLQAKVVELEPGNEVARRRLEQWQALAARAGEGATGERQEAIPATPAAPPEVVRSFDRRLHGTDCDALAAAMVQQGWCAPGCLLAERERTELLEVHAAAGAGFSQEFVVPHERRRARYRWLFDPLPELIVGLRAALWPVVVGLAAHQQELLGRQAAYPPAPEAWAASARARGARAESVRVVRLEAGAAMPPMRIENRAAFPLRAVVDLGGGDAGGEGPDDATLMLTDRRPGKKLRRHCARTAPGDVVLFCGRERLDPVGGVLGLQPVTFAFGPFAGGRLLLDLAFEGDS